MLGTFEALQFQRGRAASGGRSLVSLVASRADEHMASVSRCILARHSIGDRRVGDHRRSTVQILGRLVIGCVVSFGRNHQRRTDTDVGGVSIPTPALAELFGADWIWLLCRDGSRSLRMGCSGVCSYERRQTRCLTFTAANAPITLWFQPGAMSGASLSVIVRQLGHIAYDGRSAATSAAECPLEHRALRSPSVSET